MIKKNNIIFNQKTNTRIYNNTPNYTYDYIQMHKSIDIDTNGYKKDHLKDDTRLKDFGIFPKHYTKEYTKKEVEYVQPKKIQVVSKEILEWDI